MTLLDLLLVADILALMTSGIMMSGFVFDWLNIRGGMMIARKLHLFASYWGLILMSAHVGLHAGIVVKRIKGAAAKWLTRILALGFSAYGIYAFVSQKIANYLFLTTHFVLYDETKPDAVFVLETVAMIVLFAAVFYHLQKLLLTYPHLLLRQGRLGTRLCRRDDREQHRGDDMRRSGQSSV